MRSKKAKIKCNKKLVAGGVFFIKIGKELIEKFYEKNAKNYGARLCAAVILGVQSAFARRLNSACSAAAVSGSAAR